MIELRTDRLVLRPVQPDDRDALLALRNDPLVVGSTALATTMTADRMEEQLRRWVDLWSTRDVGTWVVEEDRRPVGFVALDPIGDGYPGVDPDALEIGVVVRPDAWGQGIAGEAGLAVATDCFVRVGLPHLYATVDTTNEQSLAVLAKVPRARLLAESEGERLYELPNPTR
jgi:[ribosomal protein S5]-alanine N-acetyltransferase